MDLKQLGLVMVLSCAIVFGAGYKTAQFNEKKKTEAVVASKSAKVMDREKAGNITVYVTGAVKKPGVYTLPDSSRTVEAINKAEPLKEADLNSINLAERLKDEMPVFVAYKSGPGSQTGKNGAGGAGSGTDTSGKAGTGGRIGSSRVSGNSSSLMVSGASVGSFSGGTGKDRININTAGSGELDRLKGIGPALAERIIDYRNEHGKFNNVSELKQVSGIGTKKFAELQEQITVR